MASSQQTLDRAVRFIDDIDPQIFLPSLLSGLIMLDMTDIVSWEPVNVWPNIVSLEAQNTQLAGDIARSRNGTSVTLNTYFFYGNPDYALPPLSRPSHWTNHRDSPWELQHPVTGLIWPAQTHHYTTSDPIDKQLRTPQDLLRVCSPS